MCLLDPPVEEARHRDVIANLGLYDASWAVAKRMELSDVAPGHNRLLLTSWAVRGGPIPELFPELEELREDGMNAEITVSLTMLSAEPRVEKETGLVFLNSNGAYRIKGAGWKQFVAESGVARGDRLDLYTCRRRSDGGRCLLVFRSNGGGGGGNARGRRRMRLVMPMPAPPPAVAANAKQSAAAQDRVVQEIEVPVVEGNTNVQRRCRPQRCTGGDYSAAEAPSSNPSSCRKGRAETRMDEKEKKAPRNLSWDSATEIEKQAAVGLLMLAWDCYY